MSAGRFVKQQGANGYDEVDLRVKGINLGSSYLSKMKPLIVAILISLTWLTTVYSQAQVPIFPKPSAPQPIPTEPMSLPSNVTDWGLSKVPKNLKHLSLTIDRHPGWLGDPEEGGPIRIRCTFKNMGHRPLAFRLADHSPYRGTEPYPYGMRIRVSNQSGVVLSSTQEFGEWWTHYYRSSDFYLEMPGDRVTLRPKEKVIRIVPLAEMLRGNQSLPKLTAGDYIIEVEMDGVVSNKLNVRVARKAN